VTLDELLALLPDNDTGDISAADLRTIVTDLYEAAHTWGTQYAYNWSTDQTPGNGKISKSNGWTAADGILHVADLSAGGLTFGTALLDGGRVSALILTAPGIAMQMKPLDVSVDQGVYRDIPVSVDKASMVAPSNNDLITLTVVAQV
jgi:hypothetical protein